MRVLQPFVIYLLLQTTISLECNQEAETDSDAVDEDDDIIPSSNGRIVSTKNGLINRAKPWRNATVYYEILKGFTSTELGLIHQAFNYYEAITCLKFKEKGSENEDYLSIQLAASRCKANIGKNGGKVDVTFAHSCFKKGIGIIIHELMHALGFYHEQSRTDRDQYIKVIEENVKPERLQNFEKIPDADISAIGVPYDYNSILHYKKRAFSKNGMDTIVPLMPEEATMMGQRKGLTNYDLSKVVKMYCGKEFIKGPLPFELV